MCVIYNTIGALSHVDLHLTANNIYDFNSISEIIRFEKDYNFIEEQIILKHKLILQEEALILNEDIHKMTDNFLNSTSALNTKLEKNLQVLNDNVEKLLLPNSSLFTILHDLFLNVIIWIKIWSAPILSNLKLFMLNFKFKKVLQQKKIRQEFLNDNFEQALKISSFIDLQHLIKKRNTIEELNNYIYGAIGEKKVEIELSKLSDDYILINDFTYTFHPALYSSKVGEYIKTVQIDHILVSASGVFLIETKNWSEKSLKNSDFRSPVQQIIRANYALYNILERSNLKNHQWGNLKIPIKNIVTFINQRPLEQFQYVKILSVNELLKYITYNPPCFSQEEVQNITNYLLENCESKNKSCKLKI
ncbi:nuclease-related domain-containing protein [Flavobacterium algicola]|uniref:nuclease-related domain-containing protein n=1 Tax=Flavobacterium algicola TaxID=556529 RepID=UPI001EFCF65D|nr:nuclease-related domain-containing protein [Flavobacterium algicola]MCG9792998.1 NERD domain-containing protein [Flavobacterium algicola]